VTTNTATADRPTRVTRRNRPGHDPLALRTETLHRLQDADLTRVVGGTRRGTFKG
jgi:hypothetical protein